MNEVELLKQLRDGLPAARPEIRAAARAELMTRIEHSAEDPRLRGGRSWWRRPRLRLAAVGVFLAALLITLLVGIVGGNGKVQPAVAEVLREAAKVASTQEPVAPGPGQYLFTRSKNAYLSAVGYDPDDPDCQSPPCEATKTWSVLVPSVRESWISFDGSRRGRVRDVSGKPRFVSADQRAGWAAAGSPPLPQTGRVEDSGLSSGAMLDASGLPTDPLKLRHLIEARKIRGVEGPPGEAETFTLIGDMLRESYLPSDVRAAIYRLTAELPGVELLGEVHDPVGRLGTGIAFTDRKRGTRHELIFDPATSALLGERESIVRSAPYGFKAPPGTQIGYAAYLESKVVDSVGQGAPAGAGGLDRSVGCYARASLHANTAIVHGAAPIATCAEIWREGAMDTSRGPSSPQLVACAQEDSPVALVFPGSGPAVCRRLGLVPFPAG
jgi:hypothetical protein